MSKSKKPEIKHILNTWALVGYPGHGNEWTIEQKIRAAKRAGFDGISFRQPLQIKELCRELGLVVVTTLDVGDMNTIEEKLWMARMAGCVAVNVQMLDDDTPTDIATPHAVKVIETGERLGLNVAIEIHRDTCTETPEKAYALADSFQKVMGRPLPMTFDFSHPALVKHLATPYWDRLAERVDLIRFANQFHLRPFNGHHCQVPATFDGKRLTPEFVAWLQFVEKLMESWISAAKPGSTMYVVPEMGSGGYFLSCFPDVWKDTQITRREIDRLFRKHVKNWRPAQKSA
ncbi:MAG: sugar phosphate isomerase/epimerase [Verrucomicrobiae bacterium]|nr:sugar phosphate isomerase/epimerase [Verrucomicrobiae bacterium]